jgi:hypothetical protein
LFGIEITISIYVFVQQQKLTLTTRIYVHSLHLLRGLSWRVLGVGDGCDASERKRRLRVVADDGEDDAGRRRNGCLRVVDDDERLRFACEVKIGVGRMIRCDERACRRRDEAVPCNRAASGVEVAVSVLPAGFAEGGDVGGAFAQHQSKRVGGGDVGLRNDDGHAEGVKAGHSVTPCEEMQASRHRRDSFQVLLL